MPKSIKFSKICGLKRRRTERNGAVSHKIDTYLAYCSYSNQFCLNSDLGRTATLFDISDKEGIATFWISYWKDLKGLQEFATSSAHRLGQNAYNKKRFPYMGIMHETYHSPKGSWETIYDNTPPLGLGKWTFQTLQYCKVFFVNAVEILQEKPST